MKEWKLIIKNYIKHIFNSIAVLLPSASFSPTLYSRNTNPAEKGAQSLLEVGRKREGSKQDSQGGGNQETQEKIFQHSIKEGVGYIPWVGWMELFRS